MVASSWCSASVIDLGMFRGLHMYARVVSCARLSGKHVRAKTPTSGWIGFRREHGHVLRQFHRDPGAEAEIPTQIVFPHEDSIYM